ncbi:hypothetical protein [Acinetobacter sp. AM]|uniref:hypothetical protein n=1 Tax=Acinetobacter sp. AM TaxID=2170730 RepID=UPI001D173CBC|nr:hypothetical protein [Acinetobacter sp. AM]
MSRRCIAITNHFGMGYAIKLQICCFVTGANRGLGLAIAREARKQGTKKYMSQCARSLGFKTEVEFLFNLM